MTAAQLRQSILQAAIQGKLVPQDAHDEPASELLKRIQAEKARLVKEGKIKKEKPLPSIAGDEAPYDLPEGWVWCRLGETITLTSGQHIESSQYNTKKEGISYLTGPTDFGTISTKISKWTLVPKVIVPKGVLLITVKGSGVGSLNFLSEEAAIGRQLMAVNSIVNYLGYLYIFLSAQRQCFSNKKIGIAIPGIGREDILDQEFPLPPLAEQQRIVAKVDELMALCDELEVAEKELDTLERDFAEHLPKSILQAAVQGKLVPQNVHDEPASVLLERIRAEKSKLIKHGKIKKDKPLPPIAEDEMPYDLPDGWVWCRMGDIFNLQAGKFIQAQNICAEDSAGKFPCYGGNGLRGYVGLYNREGTYSLIGRQGALCGNINVAKGRFYATEHAVVVESFCNMDVSWIRYSLVSLNLNKYSAATAQPGLAVNTIVRVPIPLPPLVEQQRIVAKVDELMALCNELKTADVLPIAPAQSATIIPFPAQATAPEESPAEEEYLIAARGDLQEKISAAHRQARRKVFED